MHLLSTCERFTLHTVRISCLFEKPTRTRLEKEVQGKGEDLRQVPWLQRQWKYSKAPGPQTQGLRGRRQTYFARR